MDKQEKIFADGLLWQDPHEKAPEFIKGSLVVNMAIFDQFMKANLQHASAKGWLKIIMKESKTGSIYFELDTWKPTQKQQPTPTSNTSVQPDGSDALNADDIPF